MAYPFRIYRGSNTIKDLDAQHLEMMREAILRAKQALKSYPPVDTLAERRTHEPFLENVGEADHRK